MPTTTKYDLPRKEEEKIQHQKILHFESGLPTEGTSSGSSSYDRKFLMLAKHNNANLLTNDKTLFNLGKSFLRKQNTWRVGEVLEQIESSGLCNKETIQDGINKLSKHGECLSSECARKVKDLGYEYEHNLKCSP